MVRISHIGSIQHPVNTTISGHKITPTTSVFKPMFTVPLIDFTKDSIVILVPGTNGKIIPSSLKAYVKSLMPNSQLVMLDYPANWYFSTSIVSGKTMLEKTLEYISKNKKLNTKVYIIGQSQGSLVSGEVLSNLKFKNMIDKAVLLGHPGVSDHHYANNLKIKEINNPRDFITFSWQGLSNNGIIDAVEAITSGNFIKGLPLLKVIIMNPLKVAWAAAAGLRLIPLSIFKDIPAYHNYENYYAQAVKYLAIA